MNDIAHTLYTVVQYVTGFGPTVLLPLVLFLALFFKVKPAKALRSSLIVGIGFVGIYAIFDILTSNVGPAAQAMVERTGISLPVVDLGWPPLAAITGLANRTFVIPLTMLINVAMLALNKTRTVDVDMWNYWHFAWLERWFTTVQGVLFGSVRSRYCRDRGSQTGGLVCTISGKVLRSGRYFTSDPVICRLLSDWIAVR